MARSGSPIDEQAWAVRRERALQLLDKGYSQAVVARNVGASKSWVYRLDGERRGLKPNAE